MSDAAFPAEKCAPPVWADLVLLDESGNLLSREAAAFHGLPFVGGRIKTPAGVLCKVIAVRWSTVADGSYKPKVFAEEVDLG